MNTRVSQGDVRISSPLQMTRSTDARWVGASEDLTTILDAAAPDWFNLQEDQRATLVKTGRGRQTWRVQTGSQDLFVKSFEAGRLFERWKWWLLGSPAEREWRSMREAAARGVPAVNAIAYGRQLRRPPRAVLITPIIESAQPLSDLQPPEDLPPGLRDRGVWCSTVGPALTRLLVVAHRSGFRHRDVHPNNILIRWKDGKTDALFVDLLGARFYRGPVPKRHRFADLAALVLSLSWGPEAIYRPWDVDYWLAFKSSDAAGFARPLGSESRVRHRPPREERAALSSDMGRAMKGHIRRLVRQRDRRLWRRGPYFGCLYSAGGWLATVTLKIGCRRMLPEPDVPDRTPEWWRSHLPAILEAAFLSSEAAVQTLRAAGVETDVRRPSGLFERALWSIARSPAWETFMASHRARHRGNPEPLILGVAERRRHGLIDAAVVITPATGRSDVDMPL